MFRGRYIQGGRGTFVSDISKRANAVLSACKDILDHAGNYIYVEARKAT